MGTKMMVFLVQMNTLSLLTLRLHNVLQIGSHLQTPTFWAHMITKLVKVLRSSLILWLQMETVFGIQVLYSTQTLHKLIDGAIYRNQKLCNGLTLLKSWLQFQVSQISWITKLRTLNLDLAPTILSLKALTNLLWNWETLIIAKLKKSHSISMS